ncbi:MAG: AEC family transporter [Lachnospiraceae bacterium]|nr:AEC family transporter [Lachnospiraceae bacterium]
MDNLIYSLNATIPIFIVMVVGYILRRINMLTEEFINVANKLTFKMTLPCLLLLNMLDCDIRHTFDGKYVLYCASVTITCIVVIWVVSKICFKDKSIVGEFVQGSYRGSAAILGIALLTNISGNANMAPLMMLGSVPLYNIFAVIVLTFEAPKHQTEDGRGLEAKQQIEVTGKSENETKLIRQLERRKNIKKAMIGICKNPIILSILGGMLLSFFEVEFPTIVYKTVDNVGSLTTPLALLVIGAGFEGKKAIKKVVPTLAATFIKLVLQPALFLPVAVMLGFEPDKLVASLIMLGAPTTATSYIMSKNMGHEGVLSSSIIVMTTLLSAFTITAWIFILKSMNLI